jgi:sodium/bile acid cotransporter 7
MTRSVWQSIKQHTDGFTIALVVTVALALVLPAQGEFYRAFSLASKLVVASLFFLHGLKLSPSNLWEGLTNWRLHLVIALATFALFPALGLILKPAIVFLSSDNLYQGVLFLCLLPSTVQSSIAFTSIARGNVAAAVCAASASSLFGVFVTPVLVNLFLHAQLASSLAEALTDLGLQLVLPFALGQFARPLLANWVNRRKKIIGITDRLSVMFIVYVSFSHGTTTGIWHNMSVSLFLALLICCALVLGLALCTTSLGGKLLGFSRPDRITIVFCGSKKSLITGVPMANIIFTPALASVIILPLMIFHQMQLIACSFLARHYASDKADLQ